MFLFLFNYCHYNYTDFSCYEKNLIIGYIDFVGYSANLSTMYNISTDKNDLVFRQPI